jgi:tRNA(Arg) A34 adenosine deaminase TadA
MKEGRNKSGRDLRRDLGQGMPSFMDLALDQARKAQAAGEVPVGCIIVRDGVVIAAAGNRTLADRDPTAHAEIVAIRARWAPSVLPAATSM